MLGNIAGKCCLGNWGSCFTYLRALSLRRNFRLVSSGVPKSCEAEEKKINALQPLYVCRKPYLEELLYALFLPRMRAAAAKKQKSYSYLGDEQKLLKIVFARE